MSSGGVYPNTEQTLAALSLLLNGGGIGQIQDITTAFSTAFSGREQDLRSLLTQLDKFIAYLNAQKDDIIAATDSFNKLMGQFADQRPVLDKALQAIPDALAVLKDERVQLADTLTRLGGFSALAADSVNKTKESLVAELKDTAPVLESLANAGPALTRSLSNLLTFPWPEENITKWFRGDYANSVVIFDLTLSRLDAAYLTGTRWEGNLTELEMQWGRTIGQLPQPVLRRRNPLRSCPTTWIRGRNMRSEQAHPHSTDCIRHRVAGCGLDHDLRIPQSPCPAVRYRAIHGDDATAPRRRALPTGQRHLPGNRGGTSDRGAPDRHRRGGGAIAKVGYPASPPMSKPKFTAKRRSVSSTSSWCRAATTAQP